MRDHHLEDLPGADLLDGCLHRCLELGGGALLDHLGGGAGVVHGADQRLAGLGEPPGHLPHPGHRVGVRLIDALVGGVVVDGVGDQPQLAGAMVHHGQVGRQHHHQLRDVQVVDAAVGEHLEAAHDVVAEVADETVDERRQALGPLGAQHPQRLAQHVERRAVGRQADRGLARPHRTTVAFGEGGAAADADDRPAGEHPVLGGLEQEGVRLVTGQGGVQPDGGLGVGQHLGPHRDHPGGVGLLPEPLRGREDRQGGHRASGPSVPPAVSRRVRVSKQERVPR
ncbi:hypothetical protein SDC9_123533 [bioreactor metagenome]|uniref:Uncharacterized protein n=1 Tax=bioreactor metagenome TaxID=1076179 RepID=A0A645CHX2_9ZZZZ